MAQPTTATRPAPGRGYRWTVLLAMSIAMYGTYYAFDAIGPLAPLLSRQLNFSNSDIGLLQASYSLPNVFILLAAGLIIDRLGAKNSMVLFASLVFGGLVVQSLSPRVGVMATGRVIIGIGAESYAMATHVAIARWFLRGELSLAFGVRTSFARLGSLSAQTSPTWARGAYTYWQYPLLISLGFGAVSLLGTILYWVLDRRGEKQYELGVPEHKGGQFVWRDVFKFNRSFWLLAALCVTFYACIFPFQTFGQKFLIDARGVTPQTASLLIGMEPLFSLLFMPVFGHLVDRYGRRSLLMAVGSLFLVPVFLLLVYTSIPPLIPMVMMGVSFAMVPAVLWMSIVFVVDRSRLGFASGVVDAVQQLGLVGMNLAIGWMNDRWLASSGSAAGYVPGMWLFTAAAIATVMIAVVLRRVETGPGAHGLETIRAAGPRWQDDKESFS
jgi:MFS family permease